MYAYLPADATKSTSLFSAYWTASAISWRFDEIEADVVMTWAPLSAAQTMPAASAAENPRTEPPFW
ncbi:hypothetical protein FB565_004607 [Actinoplanes lutulentus]|nr:hypothetical protein [Actinoplanes lutulentus]MBB2944874.1 hypothetical protein [Actinoplanes lutulentus]